MRLAQRLTYQGQPAPITLREFRRWYMDAGPKIDDRVPFMFRRLTTLIDRLEFDPERFAILERVRVEFEPSGRLSQTTFVTLGTILDFLEVLNERHLRLKVREIENARTLRPRP